MSWVTAERVGATILRLAQNEQQGAGVSENGSELVRQLWTDYQRLLVRCHRLEDEINSLRLDRCKIIELLTRKE